MKIRLDNVRLAFPSLFEPSRNMSKGPGQVQRAVLRALSRSRRSDGLVTAELLDRVRGSVQTTLGLAVALVMADSVFAGVELHCEMGSNSQYICDAFTFGGTELASTTWGAMSPLALTGTFGSTATFECSGDNSNGAALLEYTTTDGGFGSASHGTNCSGTGGGGGLGPPGPSQCIPVNEPCPDPQGNGPDNQ